MKTVNNLIRVFVDDFQRWMTVDHRWCQLPTHLYGCREGSRVEVHLYTVDADVHSVNNPLCEPVLPAGAGKTTESGQQIVSPTSLRLPATYPKLKNINLKQLRFKTVDRTIVYSHLLEKILNMLTYGLNWTSTKIKKWQILSNYLLIIKKMPIWQPRYWYFMTVISVLFWLEEQLLIGQPSWERKPENYNGNDLILYSQLNRVWKKTVLKAKC